MARILCYHGNSIWNPRMLAEENETDDFMLGFELEVEKKASSSVSTSLNDMANIIEENFGDLFIFERDGSLRNGFEIISHPFTLGWYKENTDIFIRLLDMLENEGFISHNSGRCGLHFHFSRESLGFTSKELEKLKEKGYSNERIKKLQNAKKSNTVENIVMLFEIYSSNIKKLSGRKNFHYCNFLLDDNFVLNSSVKSIKERTDQSDKRQRRSAVNITNAKTVEIRVMRGTLLFEAFDVRLRFIYNLITTAKECTGLVDFSKIAFRDCDDDVKERMLNYFRKRGIDDLICKKVCINFDNEFRLENINFSK